MKSFYLYRVLVSGVFLFSSGMLSAQTVFNGIDAIYLPQKKESPFGLDIGFGFGVTQSLKSTLNLAKEIGGISSNISQHLELFENIGDLGAFINDVESGINNIEPGINNLPAGDVNAIKDKFNSLKASFDELQSFYGSLSSGFNFELYLLEDFISNFRVNTILQIGARHRSQWIAFGAETGLDISFINYSGVGDGGSDIGGIALNVPLRFYLDVYKFWQVYTGFYFEGRINMPKDTAPNLANRIFYSFGTRLKGGVYFPMYLEGSYEIDLVRTGNIDNSHFRYGLGFLFNIS